MGTIDGLIGLELRSRGMAPYAVDDVDLQLLALLKEDARYTATELAERVGVSDNTIHNRMDRLAEAGVITGYTATVDHEPIGLDLFFHFTCTARISERADVARRIMEIPAVVEVTELMTGRNNLLVKVVAADDEDVSRIAAEIDDLGIEITDENLVREEHTKAIDYDAVVTLDGDES